MDAVRKDVRRLVNKELEAANKRFPQFASPHEGQNVVREELEEAERAGRSGTGDCATETLHRNPDVEHGQGKPDCAERRFQGHSGSRSKSGYRSNSGGSNGEEV